MNTPDADVNTETSTLDTAARSRCAALARWIDAGVAFTVLSLGCALLAASGLLLHAWIGVEASPAIFVLLLILPERYLALRLRFDRGLFDDLASGRIANLAALDVALAALGLRNTTHMTRDLDDRIAGTLQLWRYHLAVVVLQTVSLAIAVAFA